MVVRKETAGSESEPEAGRRHNPAHVTDRAPTRLSRVTYTLASMKPLNRFARLAGALALALTISGCSTSGGASPTSGCDHWCGNGSARVVLAGQTTAIQGGGCYDTGGGVMDVRIGDWQENGSGNFLALTGSRPGTAHAATPVPTDANGDPTADPPVQGSVGGVPFALDYNSTVTFTSVSTGTFSGNDLNGAGDVTGTFTC